VIKINENQTLKLTFDHIKDGKPASLFIAMNPLTGDWLQEHKHDDATTAYYGTKSAALHLANLIVKKLKDKNLSCNVEIKNVK